MKYLIRGMIVVFLYGMSSTCHSQSKEKIDSAKKLVLAISDQDPQREAIQNSLQKYFAEQYMYIAGSVMDERTEPLEVESRIRIFEKIEKNLKEITKKMILETSFREEFDLIGTNFYAENFSPSELKEIEVFFDSPTGRKFKLTAPKIAHMLSPLMEKWFPVWTEQFKNEVRVLLKKVN